MKCYRCLAEMKEVMSSNSLGMVIWWCPDCGTMMKIIDDDIPKAEVFETRLKLSQEQVQEIIAGLEYCAKTAKTDMEGAHASADNILVQVVEDLGYLDIAEKYDKISKWYA